jgi:hypothetical protein
MSSSPSSSPPPPPIIDNTPQQQLRQQQRIQQQQLETLVNITNNTQMSRTIMETLRDPQFYSGITKLPNNTCFVRAVTIGGGMAIALFTTRYRFTQSIWRSIDFGFFGLMIGSGVSYYHCRISERNRFQEAIIKAQHGGSIKMSKSMESSKSM